MANDDGIFIVAFAMHTGCSHEVDMEGKEKEMTDDEDNDFLLLCLLQLT